MTDKPHVPERARRPPTTALAVIIIAFVLFQAAYFVAQRLEADNASSRRDCLSQLQAHLTASALRALAAPPVDPNATPAEVAKTTRGMQIADGLATADKIDHPDRWC